MPNEFQTFNTAIGWCAVAGRGEQVCAVTVGHRSAENAVAVYGKIAGGGRSPIDVESAAGSAHDRGVGRGAG